METIREAQREPVIGNRDCSLGIITLKHFEWKAHNAQLVDLSTKGVGIESKGLLEPGFVWFKDRVGGHKGGVLVWSKQLGTKYRAGIRFLNLSHDEEEYVEERIDRFKPHIPLREPEKIISTLIESEKKEGH
ncbi:MAG TPA: hypothetical protein DCP92_10675 [Nitrospiraceae bacterium]|jgi:hypothetical protein|nr:hypothetical protein [Nitrospiraceae bacterium]